ncbi:MAG: putative Zn-dependent peptidase [Acidimicrobiaceae bacterium]|nr:putative Zn-dependent peptidase [Acidimicrobiaceae bacterium]
MIRISQLGCGIRLVTESMPGVRSVCTGFWVGTGSRDESGPQVGISHFLEHLLFKGTPTRSARSIAEDIDAVGGDMNAFTTKEYTTFYVRTLAEDLDLGLDILSDIVWNPALRPEEVDAERQVILEEVLMHLDEPADVVQERFAEALFPGHPLGREVLGLPEVISNVSVPEIRSFFDEHYRPGNIVVAVAGDVDHDKVAEGIDSRFAGSGAGAPPVRTPPGDEVRALDVLSRDTEQAHLVVGMRGPERRSPERFALSLLNHSLGGGISSRLFQKIREERGLAYSVVSDRIAYADAGAMAVSVGTAPERAKEVLRLVLAELEDLAANGVTKQELELAKSHLRADTILSLEDSGARMSRIGASLLLHGEVLTVEEVTAKIEAVTLAEVAEAAERVLGSPKVLAVVGPFTSEEFSSELR